MSAPAIAPAESFGTALLNVRRLTGSGLTHQAKPAQLLVAIEQAISSTLPSSALPHSATAYFAALLQCLEKACAEDVGGEDEEMAETENMGQGALIPATLYLLAIVIPETSTQVVLSKVSPLLECILPLYQTALDHPPALRSILQITTTLLVAAPPGLLNSSPLLKKAWNYLLEINVDPRPKVRHLAQEGVRKVLCTPIPPRVTIGAHPYLPRARDWVVAHLEEEAKTGGASSKKKSARFAADAEDMEGKKAIWVVQGLRGWVAVWGEDQLSQLCSLLLSLPPLPHLTPQIYSLLALLLQPPPADVLGPKPAVLQNLPTILDSLLGSPPDQQSHLADIPAYLSAITSALIKMSFQDPVSLTVYLSKSFNLIFNSIMLAPSASPAVLSAASDAIGNRGIVRYCISDEMIVSAVNYHRSGSDLPGARQKQKSTFLSKLLVSLVEAMDKHSLRIQYLLPILTAIVSRLRLRVTDGRVAEIDPSGRGKTAAEELVLDLIGDIGDLRMARGFDHKEKVDEVVGMGIEVIGVEGILKVLPLNIEPDADGNTPQPGRAHLLPLIRSHTTNDSLTFFATYFRPLSERVFSRKVAAEDGGRGAEAKIWEVLVGQVWDAFPGFCEIPRDLKEGLSTPFMTLIANLLNTQPMLLPALLKGLAAIVSSTRTLLSSTTASEELLKQFGVDQAMAQANMEYLKTMAKDTTSVLLNVFSQLPREQRGMVSDVIGLWTGIMTEQDIIATFTTVTTHLSSNLSISAPVAPGSSPISHTMLDLLIIFVPHLPAAQARALFNAMAQQAMLEHDDATVQKKSYRLLKRLIEDGKVSDLLQGEKIGGFVRALEGCAAGVGPGAQRDRLQLISTVVQALPKDQLNLIPELLSEAVLGTKEVNEKARDAGFELLVVMGQKMAQGGEVRREGGDDEGMSSAAASVEEYITMVAAGLTGTTPHMISASINALSRLLFEFKDDVSDGLITELVSTITVFLTMKNREIIKSALGFIKVATVALPAATVQPHLPVLVPALLGWVHDHKNHFKSKTVHIFERMMRKFGSETILSNAPAGGERKVLEGIKKRKERAKRKKAAGADEDEEEEEKPKNSSGSAFDDILYNSDTDDELDENEEDAPKGRNGKPLAKKERKAAGTAYIRNEGDQPMDLLSRSIAGGVSSVNPNASSRKRKPGQDASHFKTDATGKLIIEDDEAAPVSAQAGDSLAGSAFMSAQRGVDGQTRDAKGNLRFNKNNRQAREEEMTMMDDLDEGDSQSKKKVAERRKKRMEMGKLGGEFKAKRAGGDIKKAGGPDPYSYVPIGQAARGNNGTKGVKVSLTNKKKGSRK